MVQPKTSEASN